LNDKNNPINLNFYSITLKNLILVKFGRYL
jgi:hypothetical protein